MTPDMRDLDNLLQQLREKHQTFYYAAVFFWALGIVGLACLLGLLRHSIGSIE